MSRKTKTPKWLSIVRKLYLYIGGTAIYTLIEYFELSQKDTKLAIEVYGFVAIAIQLTCDAYFLKESEPLPKFPKEAKDLRE